MVKVNDQLLGLQKIYIPAPGSIGPDNQEHLVAEKLIAVTQRIDFTGAFWYCRIVFIYLISNLALISYLSLIEAILSISSPDRSC